MNGSNLALLLLLATVAVTSILPLSYALESTGNFTAPTVSRVWYGGNYVRFLTGWISGGPGMFTVKAILGSQRTAARIPTWPMR